MRRLDEVITSAKIIRDFDTNIKFLTSVSNTKSKQEVLDNFPCYVSISDRGHIKVYSHNTLELEMEQSLDVDVHHLLKFDQKTLLLCTPDAVLSVKRSDDVFEITKIPVPKALFTFEIPKTKGYKYTFGIVTSDGRLVLSDGGEKLIDIPFVTDKIVDHCVIPSDPPVLAVLAPHLIMIPLKKKGKKIENTKVSGAHKIVMCSPNTLSIVHDKEVHFLKLGRDMTVNSSELVVPHHARVMDLVAIDENTVVGCGKSVAFLYTNDKTKGIISASLDADKQIERIIPMVTCKAPGVPYVFACICTDGTMAVVRVPTDKQEKKKVQLEFPARLEVNVLQNLNRGRVLHFASALDASYLTVSESNHVILWESLTDWWSAPYYSYVEKVQLGDAKFFGL